MAEFAIHSACLSFALLLFVLINWIGRHAVSFGYSSTTLFTDANESVALNFLFRTLPPAVLMILLSAIAVGSGNDDLRLQIYWIAPYYYALRATYYLLFNLHRLINWPRFIFHTAIGLLLAWAAFQYLILPKKSLLPDLETAGNELWLLLLIFVFSVGNNIVLPDSKGASRRNSFILRSYSNARRMYGSRIEEQMHRDELQLIAYAIIVYEGFCRPPTVRVIERFCFWKGAKTTGVMQVFSKRPLTDEESVALGIEKLNEAWRQHWSANVYSRARSVIADYNRDQDYIHNIMEIMEIIAKRVDARFESAYKNIWGTSHSRFMRPQRARLTLLRKAKQSKRGTYRKTR
jgi:hypothetical protein